MSVYRISYRYANSLFQLALEKNALKKFADDAELIYNTLVGSKELRSILRNPVIKLKVKKELLESLFKDRIGSELGGFINFIVEKNREEILTEIMYEFLNLRDRKEGIIRAKVYSADTLTDELKKELESRLEKQTSKKVFPKYSVDQKLIGGFVVQIHDTVMDASVKHQLELLRKKFSEDISVSKN